VAVWHPIPGETPIDDFSDLLVKGISTRAELAVHEAANIRKAFVKYLTGKPNRRTARFDFSWTLRLHKEMFGQVWKWAGSVRTTDLNLGVSWPQIEPRLYDLLNNLWHWKTAGTDLLEQAVMLHHQSVQIHPFMNGNGRWSRLLANVWLKMHRQPVTEWPEATVGTQSTIRATYLDAIRQADEGDYAALLELHRRFTPDSGS